MKRVISSAVRRAEEAPQASAARKRSEEAAQRRERRFRALTERSQDLVSINDRDGTYLYVNPAHEEVYGFKPDELVGRNAFDLLHPDDMERLVPVLAEAVRTGEGEATIEYRLRHKDGSWHAFEGIALNLLNDPDVAGILITGRDITKRRRAEAAARESEERFRRLFESSRDALMTLEPPVWRFTSGNPATVKMFGAKNEEDFISRGPSDLSPERQPDGHASAEKIKEMIETAVREGSHFFEWTHRRIGGEEFPAEVLLTRMEQGGKVFLQATVRDITARKRGEEQLLVQSTALASAANTDGVLRCTPRSRDLPRIQGTEG